MREEVRGGGSASAGASSYILAFIASLEVGKILCIINNVKDLKTFIDYGKYSKYISY